MTPRRPDPELPAQEFEEIVRNALKEIGQGTALKSKVEKAVKYVQGMKATEKSEWSYNLRRGVLTKKQRDGAQRVASALKALRGALAPLEADRLFQRRLQLEIEPDESIDFPMDRVALQKWEDHFQKIAATKVRPGSKFDARKMVAAQQAAKLLEAAGLPLDRARGGKFEALASILYNDPDDADFFSYCGRYVKLQAQREPVRNGTRDSFRSKLRWRFPVL